MGQDMGMGEEDDDILIEELELRNRQLVDFNNELLQEIEDLKAELIRVQSND